MKFLIIGLCALVSQGLCALEFPAMDEHPPKVQSGAVAGIVTDLNKEKGVVEIETKDGKMVFAPHWKGGMPKDGGGLDAKVITAVKRLRKGDTITIVWTWSERNRIEKITVDKKSEKAHKE